MLHVNSTDAITAAADGTVRDSAQRSTKKSGKGHGHPWAFSEKRPGVDRAVPGKSGREEFIEQGNDPVDILPCDIEMGHQPNPLSGGYQHAVIGQERPQGTDRR